MKKYQQNQRLIQNYLSSPYTTDDMSDQVALAALENQDYIKRLRSGYITLFESATTDTIQPRLQQSLSNNNGPAIQAAIEVLVQRRDYDPLSCTLSEFSKAENATHVANTLIRHNGDSAVFYAYAKTLRIRHGKAAIGQAIKGFVSFNDFVSGNRQPEEDADIVAALTLSALLAAIPDPTVVATQAPDTFDRLLKMAQKGQLHANPQDPQSILGFTLKQLRSAASSGRMNSEQLDKLNTLLVGGFKTKKNPVTGSLEISMTPDAQAFFDTQTVLIRSNIQEYLTFMSASQLTHMHGSTFDALDQTLHYIENGDLNGYTADTECVTLKTWLSNTIAAISKPIATSMRSSMSPTIAKKLDIRLF